MQSIIVIDFYFAMFFFGYVFLERFAIFRSYEMEEWAISLITVSLKKERSHFFSISLEINKIDRNFGKILWSSQM